MIDPNSPDFTMTPAARPRRFSYERAGEPAPAVSVVTPFFNTGAIFHETATTVLAQSFQNWEWLIVNDGSTDPVALSVLDQYRGRDPRIRVLDLPENRGLSAARNAGYAMASADFVVQLDSDDLLEPTAIETWAWFLVGCPEAAFVKGYSVGFGAQSYLWRRGFEQGVAFLEENQVDPTAMVRRSVHRAVDGYDTARRGGLEDWEFWLRCAAAGLWGGTVPEFLSWYRRRDNHGDRWMSWNQEGLAEFRREARQRYPALFEDDGFPALPIPAHPGDLPEPRLANPLAKKGRRLLLLVPWLVAGGVEKSNLDLIAQLQRHGWEITVVASLAATHEWYPRFTELTPDVFVLPHFLNAGHGPDFVQYLVESRQPDAVLLSHSELAYTLLPFLRARCPAVPVVDLNHIEEMHWRNGGYPRDSVDNQALLDQQIVISEHLRQWMIARGAEPGKIAVCHLNVDEREWRPDLSVRAAVRRELGIDPAVPVIVFAGRVCAQKQPLVLAATLNALPRRRKRFVALVAGDGEDMPALRRAVSNGPAASRTRLLGMTPNRRVRQLMQAADLFFLPSEWEGIALSIYEAMACGLAIVGADVGGQRELVTRECGVLVPRSSAAEEAAAYADAIAGLIGDPARLRAMGQASRSRIEAGFRLEQMGDRMAELLAGVVARGSQAAVPSAADAEASRAQAVAHLAEQWEYVKREAARSAEMAQRMPDIVPAPPGYRRYLLSARRLWLAGGWRAVLSRVRERLGS
jgi:glycosyltransferase involved in cell wall biosynthesis/GT2 family glycosyltransferase